MEIFSDKQTDEQEEKHDKEPYNDGDNGGFPDDCGSILTDKNGTSIRTITVIGQIEGHYLCPSTQKTTKYEHLLPLLVSVEESEDVDGLLLMLNTVGGDVEAGLAIAELVASMRKPTVSLVLGGGHSIGVPLAVAAKKSFIVPSATMTVHPVRISGTVVGAPQTYRYFEKMQNRITDFVVRHSKISRERFASLLMQTDEIATDVGTILEGEDAVREGLIDRVGGLGEALCELRQMIGESEPAGRS